MNGDKYDHGAVEARWIERWEAEGTYEVDLEAARNPYYNLMMFPYPSAEGMHVGNVFAYTGADIHGRYMRARGYDVFEPMGFDAFGIHSENFALKINTHPGRLIPENIANFTRQFKRLGAMFDWRHEVQSTDPDYYRWTQWIFIQLFKAGLAYQKEAPVTWCPSCNTVLAAEQAEDGVCERCDAQVEQRNMRQWFFRITAYARQLLENLETIDWSETTKTAQRRWIGRSEGAEADFPLADHEEKLSVFTTRPDTLWGATYMVLAPEHPFVDVVTTETQRAAVREYVKESGRKTAIEREDVTREKTGVFTGGYAVNPVNDTRIPIWISDYVLMTYGTGAIMAVPAHDQRDFEFARAFDLPIVQVISGSEDTTNGYDGASASVLEEAYTGEGTMINSGPFDGTHSTAGVGAVTDWLEERGVGKRQVNYRLRDWCISRQRYWGPPIPMIHCGECGVVPVPEDQLPVILPHVEDFRPDGTGRSPAGARPVLPEHHMPRLRRSRHPGDRRQRQLPRFGVVLLPVPQLGTRGRGFRPGDDGAVASRGHVRGRQRARGAAPHVYPLHYDGDARHRPGLLLRTVQEVPGPRHHHPFRREDEQVQGERGQSRRLPGPFRRGRLPHLSHVPGPLPGGR